MGTRADRRLFPAVYAVRLLIHPASPLPPVTAAPMPARRSQRKIPLPAPTTSGASAGLPARLAQWLRRPPPLYPCVRAFFVALYWPGPLTVSANSLDSFLPSLVQTAP